MPTLTLLSVGETVDNDWLIKCADRAVANSKHADARRVGEPREVSRNTWHELRSLGRVGDETAHYDDNTIGVTYEVDYEDIA